MADRGESFYWKKFQESTETIVALLTYIATKEIEHRTSLQLPEYVTVALSFLIAVLVGNGFSKQLLTRPEFSVEITATNGNIVDGQLVITNCANNSEPLVTVEVRSAKPSILSAYLVGRTGEMWLHLSVSFPQVVSYGAEQSNSPIQSAGPGVVAMRIPARLEAGLIAQSSFRWIVANPSLSARDVGLSVKIADQNGQKIRGSKMFRVTANCETLSIHP